MWLGKNDYDRGTAELQKAITSMPEHYEAYVSLSKAHEFQGQFEQAERQYGLAIENAQRQAEAEELAPATLSLLYRNRA